MTSMTTARSGLRPASRLGLGLVALGMVVNITLIVLLLGDAVRPGQLSLPAVALLATGGGVLLVLGLALADPGHRR